MTRDRLGSQTSTPILLCLDLFPHYHLSTSKSITAISTSFRKDWETTSQSEIWLSEWKQPAPEMRTISFHQSETLTMLHIVIRQQKANLVTIPSVAAIHRLSSDGQRCATLFPSAESFCCQPTSVHQCGRSLRPPFPTSKC